MKTNVQIELTDAERNRLAKMIDGKQSKRLVSRKEVVALAQQHFAGLVGALAGDDKTRAQIMLQSANIPPEKLDIYKADPADIPLMAQPDNPGYVRGWNLVKRGAGV
jgi:hypothetical protein